MKEKLKSFLIRLKQNGIKATLRKAKNYMLYKNTVPNEYKEWILNNEPNEKMIENQKAFISCQNIKFDLFLNSKNDMQEESINKQTYNKFEIKYVKDNNYIELLEKSDADYTIFMDDTVLLAPFALYEIVQAIQRDNSMMIYSDNDYIINNNRENPDFKLGFGIDTILSKNYIGNFIIFKNNFLKANLDIFENLNKDIYYDLILKVAEKTNKITHIQKILYHITKESNIDTISQKKSIEEYLNRNSLEYETIKDGKNKGEYKIEYKIIENPKVSIVIPNKDQIEDLKKCIDSIKKSTYKNYEIVIVENNSEKDETLDYYKQLQQDSSNIKIEKFNINYFNYSAIVNYGVEKSSGEYVILLNNDIEVITNNWIEQLLMYCQRENVGICGAKLYFPDDTIQHAGVILGIRGLAGHIYREVNENDENTENINLLQNLNAVTAACFMVKKDLYDKVLGFDEKLAVAFNDIDFCLKIRENKLIVYNPFVELYHYESKTRGEDTSKEKQERFAREYETFVRRWSRKLQKGDNYYNVNYRLDSDLVKINYNKIMN